MPLHYMRAARVRNPMAIHHATFYLGVLLFFFLFWRVGRFQLPNLRRATLKPSLGLIAQLVRAYGQ